jgi:hypothetical protein
MINLCNILQELFVLSWQLGKTVTANDVLELIERYPAYELELKAIAEIFKCAN